MKQYDMVLDILKTFEGHAGRKGQRGGSVARKETVGSLEKEISQELGIAVKYGKISTEMAKELNTSLRDLKNKFGMPTGLTSIKPKELEFSLSKAVLGLYTRYTDGTSEIFLNKKVFEILGSGDKESRDWILGRAGKDWVKTNLTLHQQALVHEMGHAYTKDDALMRDKGYEQFAQSITEKAGGSFMFGGFEKIEKDIPSKYAMTNKYEFIAESFVQAHYGEKKITDFQGGMLEKYARLHK